MEVFSSHLGKAGVHSPISGKLDRLLPRLERLATGRCGVVTNSTLTPVQSERKELVESVRNKIDNGTYETLAHLEGAVDGLLDREIACYVCGGTCIRDGECQSCGTRTNQAQCCD